MHYHLESAYIHIFGLHFGFLNFLTLFFNIINPQPNACKLILAYIFNDSPTFHLHYPFVFNAVKCCFVIINEAHMHIPLLKFCVSVLKKENCLSCSEALNPNWVSEFWISIYFSFIITIVLPPGVMKRGSLVQLNFSVRWYFLICKNLV